MLIGATGLNGLLLLAVLACPLGMGLMMFFMGRGMMRGNKHTDNHDHEDHSRSLAEMKAEQARLAEKIEALEERGAGSEVAEPAVERDPDRVS